MSTSVPIGNAQLLPAPLAARRRKAAAWATLPVQRRVYPHALATVDRKEDNDPMATRSVVSPAEQLDCLVDLTWPAGRGVWWSVYHVGSGAQVAAALDELARRVDLDHWTRVLSMLERPLIGCDLTVYRADTSVIDQASTAVLVGTLPAVLRSHAVIIRDHIR